MRMRPLSDIGGASCENYRQPGCTVVGVHSCMSSAYWWYWKPWSATTLTTGMQLGLSVRAVYPEGRLTGHFSQSSPVCAKRCCSVNRRSSPLGSHHWHPCQFSLAACHWASEVQAGGHRLPSTPRHCTLTDVLRPVADMPSRRRFRSSTSSQLDVRPLDLRVAAVQKRNPTWS